MRESGVVFLPKSRYVELIKAERELRKLEKNPIEENKLIEILQNIEKLTQGARPKDEMSEDVAKKLDEIKRMIRNVSFVGSGTATSSPTDRIEIEEIDEGEIDMEMDDEDVDVLIGD